MPHAQQKGRNTMTTQTTMKIVSTNYFNGHQLNIYGSEQEPRFLARESIKKWGH